MPKRARADTVEDEILVILFANRTSAGRFTHLGLKAQRVTWESLAQASRETAESSAVAGGLQVMVPAPCHMAREDL